MADYHFVYKDLEGASTQWDDIQRKLGNLPPKAPAFKPPSFTPAEDPDSKPKDKAWVDDKTEEELEDLEDDLDDDRFLQEYRKKRLAEMRELAKIARFGSVMPISGSDFVREVSQAPADVWVVVVLYKDGAVKANYVGLRSFGRKCTPEGVALVLCQSDPVLNDGQGGGDQSKKDVLDGVRKRFIEKVVTAREDDDGSSSD
ncbi:uncharacterized protein [Coffea arabica]|uniref:Uncharacterized protein isoform X2 n=1 Tax=Coffea arabica TaxID=13443 RepID=A0A6P6UFM3_COFAR|nr:phosducin-like protein 3 isoform X2 [Coffea arabica]